MFQLVEKMEISFFRSPAFKRRAELGGFGPATSPAPPAGAGCWRPEWPPAARLGFGLFAEPGEALGGEARFVVRLRHGVPPNWDWDSHGLVWLVGPLVWFP